LLKQDSEAAIAADAAVHRRRFRLIASAGIFFQGGAATVDTGTIIPALVHGLTGGSAVAVGAAAAIVRSGWLIPQLVIGHLAQRRRERMPLYKIGAFGRVVCLTGLAGLVAMAGDRPDAWVIAAFFLLWTVYAFVSGIVAVPYNDIVARLIVSERRSRVLAARFFGGGLLALAVAGAADRLLGALPFPQSFAAVLVLGASLLGISALSFVTAGEPPAPPPPPGAHNFLRFLSAGVVVFRTDRLFRLFVYVQWLGGAVSMALPFYVLQATEAGASASDVPVLLAAQTVGALVSNLLWGWWGDARGKRSLLEIVAAGGAVAPLLTLSWVASGGSGAATPLPWFAVTFVVLGAVGNGGTIAYLGYLMEISPDDRRPAYSGYFNALIAPAAFLPLAGAALVEAKSYAWIFAASGIAALLQFLMVRRLRLADEQRSNP
jgi:MFS family permease